MYSHDELFLCALKCYSGVYFPPCATREMNTKITLSWALTQFVTQVHALFSIYLNRVRPNHHMVLWNIMLYTALQLLKYYMHYIFNSLDRAHASPLLMTRGVFIANIYHITTRPHCTWSNFINATSDYCHVLWPLTPPTTCSQLLAEIAAQQE